MNHIGDCKAIPLDISGFELLPEKQKRLIYHLTEAGHWGHVISLMQTSEFNLDVIKLFAFAFHSIEKEKINVSDNIRNEIRSALFTLFSHSGIYHHTTYEKLDLGLSDETLTFLSDFNLKLFERYYIAFSNETPQFQTLQNDKDDVVKKSGVGFYKGEIRTQDILDYQYNYLTSLESEDEIRSPNFLNVIFHQRLDGGIYPEVLNSSNPTFGYYIHNIIKSLSKALNYVENEQQKLSIETLIHFYISGKSTDFDLHSIEWTRDKNSNIYFVNGFIESYDDPLGNVCTYESLVAFKNPKDEDRVNAIIDNIQYFEDSLPVDPKFKKEKALGLSASSVNVVSMSGKTSPVLPLGINLPNSAWIREEFGSKSVTLSNVANSRASAESPLSSEMYLPEYTSLIHNYDNLNRNLHIDLHEIAGHGSCKSMDGVTKSDLSSYYAIIEEARADLVALYYCADPELENMNIYPKGKTNDIALARYVSYFTDALMIQLRRIKLGNDLTQAHLRNRQLIASYVLSHLNESQAFLTNISGKHYIRINDMTSVRQKIGDLLFEIQRIKSIGDLEAAKKIVETYGTKINLSLHKEVLDRVSSLNLASTISYIAPTLQVNKLGNIESILNNDFIEKQMNDFFKYYF